MWPTNFRSRGDRELTSFVSTNHMNPLFSLTGEWCNIFRSLLVALRTQQTRRHSEIKKKQIDNDARLFWGSIDKTKYRGLTSLAFIQLVPGGDRVDRHICIRCMLAVLEEKIYRTTQKDTEKLKSFLWKQKESK